VWLPRHVRYLTASAGSIFRVRADVLTALLGLLLVAVLFYFSSLLGLIGLIVWFVWLFAR
jgi:hypothetical protein